MPRIIAISALLLGLVAPALAHDHPMSKFNVVQIPGGWIGGAMWITGIGPPAGVEVVHAKASITFTPGSGFSAANLAIAVRVPIVGGSKEWLFTGADLGFGSGPGTYSATIGTDVLNGPVAPGLPGFPSTVLIDIMATHGGAMGSFTSSAIEIEWNETLTSSVTEISVATGGSQGLALDFGTAFGGRKYGILGTATGTAPGTLMLGKVMPLNYDAYLMFTASSPNSVLMPQSVGTLAAAGTGQTQFKVPPGLPASAVGLTLHHAALVLDGSGGAGDAVSIPVPVTFVP